MSQFAGSSSAEEAEIEVVEAVEWSPPEGARVPEGSTFVLGPDDGYCRLLKPDGTRCQGIRMHETGLCPPHSGRSRILDDPRGMQARSAQGKARVRERHQLLASNGVNPRRAAREVAIRRSDAVVRALVDDVLDDPDMSTQARQRAVIGMLDAVFPLSTTTVEVELPADPDAVESLGWSDMQRIAARLAIEAEGVSEG